MSDPLLPFDTWPAGITQADVPFNNNVRRAEILSRPVVSATTTAQPSLSSPADDYKVYIIPASATGSQWATFAENDIAIFIGGTWTGFGPPNGLVKFVVDEDANWQFKTGGGWAAEGGGGGAVSSVVAGAGIDVDATDPANPEVALDSASIASLALADSAVQPADSATTLNMDTARLLGRTTASTGAVEEITVGSGLSLAAGALTATGGGGDVVGPASATDDSVVLFDGTTGKLIKGGVTIAEIQRISQNSQSAAYTAVLADANKHLLHPSADTTARIFTIPANSSVAYPIGTTLTFVNQNGAGVITIAITSDTMRLAGAGTTGSRTLAANGVATALKITSTEWIINGTGLT